MTPIRRKRLIAIQSWMKKDEGLKAAVEQKVDGTSLQDSSDQAISDMFWEVIKWRGRNGS